MICLNCHDRWADFPKEDYQPDEDGNFVQSKGADERRMEKFNSDEVVYCGCIERDQEFRDQLARFVA